MITFYFFLSETLARILCKLMLILDLFPLICYSVTVLLGDYSIIILCSLWICTFSIVSSYFYIIGLGPLISFSSTLAIILRVMRVLMSTSKTNSVIVMDIMLTFWLVVIPKSKNGVTFYIYLAYFYLLNILSSSSIPTFSLNGCYLVYPIALNIPLSVKI